MPNGRPGEHRSTGLSNHRLASILSFESRWMVCLPVAMMVAIQYVSGLPEPERLLTVPTTLLGFDSASSGLSYLEARGLVKVILNGLHVPVFALLAILWCWALAPWSAVWVRRVLGAFLISGMFGVLNEVTQLWVPGRLAAVHDAVANVVGAAFGLLLLALAVRVRRGAPVRKELVG